MPMSQFFGGATGAGAGPEGSSAPDAGIMSGVAIGSMFGPVGMALGAVVGGVLSFGDDSKEKARKAATEQSYQFARDVYDYVGAGREQVEKEYSTGQSQVRARYAASGASLSGSGYEAVQGKLIADRDEAMGKLDAELETFRAGEAYRWLRKDIDFMTRPMSKSPGGRGALTTFSVGARGNKGRSGEHIFTNAQHASLRTVSFRDTDHGKLKIFNEYVDRLRPDISAYERGKFGTKAEQKQFKADMDDRITSANAWYDRQLKIQETTRANNRAFHAAKGNDR